MSKRRDYYEVLGVSMTATQEEIAKAYKKMAVKLHPDKNLDNPEEAAKKFDELLSAYNVLKEPTERKWYDDHRDLILRAAEMEDEEITPLYDYFNRDVFDSFDESENGFYTVYDRLFKKLKEEEKNTKLGDFGGMNSGFAVVKEFYEGWSKFQSNMEFYNKMPHDLTEAPNRTVRRIMEKENKKIKDKLRKDRTQNVKQLVLFVQRLDPRWEGVKKEMERIKEEREERQRLHEEENQRKFEQMQQRQRELNEMNQKEYVIDENEEAALNSVLKYYSAQDEVPSTLGKEDADGEENDNDDEEVVHEYACVICEKVFKSENQLRSHENSKKHKQMVRLFKKQMKDME